ncbi:MAG: DNA-3-methyladenine glycosylase [Actinomycetota bacterium]
MTGGRPLEPDFYDRDPREVAVDLLGCVLVHDSPEGRASGVIVETEAYRSDDPACHAYRGPTMRNRNLFGPPGVAYVYLSYGMHYLINAVCEGEGTGSAVLIRALRPLEGVPLMVRRRGREDGLCNGPGKLAQALGVDRALDGCCLICGRLAVYPGEEPSGEIIATTRIGISRGTELPWRYLIEGEPDVSRPPLEILERGLMRTPAIRGSSVRRLRSPSG